MTRASDVDSRFVGDACTARGRATVYRCVTTVSGDIPPRDGTYGIRPSSRSVLLIFCGLATMGRRGSRNRLSTRTSWPAVVATSTDFGVKPATVCVTANAATGAPKAYP